MKYEDSEIILIEYFDNIPHSVYTTDGVYDFDIHGSNGFIMYIQSGWGNNWPDKNIIWKTELAFPAEKKSKLWVNPEYTIRIKHPGYTVIEKPIIIDSKENPFDYGYEVDDIVYCDKCGLFWDDSGCPDHEWPDE